MPNKLGTVTASLTFALAFGLASPALADALPPEPADEQPAPPEQPKVEAPTEPEAKTEPAPEAKPDGKADAKQDEKADAKSGSCSVTPERDLFGLALIVLLLSGAALKRRRG